MAVKAENNNDGTVCAYFPDSIKNFHSDLTGKVRYYSHLGRVRSTDSIWATLQPKVTAIQSVCSEYLVSSSTPIFLLFSQRVFRYNVLFPQEQVFLVL